MRGGSLVAGLPAGSSASFGLARDGKVYSSSDGRLFQYDPTTDVLMIVADELNGQFYVHDLTIDASGDIVGCTTPGGRCFVWNNLVPAVSEGGLGAWVQKAAQYGSEHTYSILGVNRYGYVHFAGTFPGAYLLGRTAVGGWVPLTAAAPFGEWAIHFLLDYGGAIYGSTEGHGMLLRYNNGTGAWDQMAPQFSADDTSVITLIEFEGSIYGTGYNKLLRWNGVDAWENAADTANNIGRLHFIAEHGGTIYGCTLAGHIVKWNRTSGLLELIAFSTDVGFVGLVTIGDALYAVGEGTGEGGVFSVQRYPELVLHSLIRAFVWQLQDAEDEGNDLYRERILDNAAGAMVDLIGAIVGEPREGRTDVEYKLAIKDRILLNTANGTPENVIHGVEILTDAGDVRLRELQPATLEVFTDGEIMFGQDTNRRVKSIIAAGVRLVLKSFFDGVIFTFDWDGGTPTEGKGVDEYNYLESGQHVGGQLCELIST